MSSRRRRGNARQRLQKALKEQRILEHELEQLNSAKSQQESAKEIMKYVQQNGQDPMLAPPEDNQFKAGPAVGCQCLIM